MKTFTSKMLILILSLTVLPFLLSTTCLKEESDPEIVDFYPDTGYSTFIYEGDDIRFHVEVTGVSGYHYFIWVFEGGDPERYEYSDPLITYWNEGTYTVSVRVITDAGASTWLIKNNYITVYSTSNDPNNINPYYEEIEADEEY